jgi:hypothetical protein
MPRSGVVDDFGRSSSPEDPNFRGQQDSRRSGNGRRIQDLADPLKWIGIGLLGTYVVTVIAAALPVKLMDPIWINRICGSIRGGVSFPLEAMALIMLGAYLQRTGKEPPMVTDFRRLCSWVALGFVLMIPLQSWAGQKLTDLAVQNQQARIEPAQKALKAVYAATNAEELLNAIRIIPGAPPNVSGRFEEPVPKVRERLISEIEPQVRQQKEQLKLVTGEIRRDSFIKLIKDGFVALFSALAFAAIGRSKPYKPTLLQSLFGSSRTSSAAMEEFSRMADEHEQT